MPGFFKAEINPLDVKLQKKRLSGSGALAREFGIPPFSIFDARSGIWQERKRAWISLGIQSELGRGEHKEGSSSPGRSLRPAATTFNGHTVRGDGYGKPLKYGKLITGAESYTCGGPADIKKRYDRREQYTGTGTSIFDPVLSEIAYRWFCPRQGSVLDPFAGGSVRGIVANSLSLSYTGVDLSREQVRSNYEQSDRICREPKPRWIEGDSLHIKTLAGQRRYDFVFSCPPFWNLEQYSDDVRDLSNFSLDDFCVAYRRIIRRSIQLLRNHRFASFVVGDVRDNEHLYIDLRGITVDAFHDAGARLYNEAILITAMGSLPLRCRQKFKASRKLGRTHQYVLFFVKGDWKRAVKAVKRRRVHPHP